MKAATKKQNDWISLLNFYAGENKDRPTRLGVFEAGQNENQDYWLEDGLPLTGIDVDPGPDSMTIELMLGTYTHVIKNVVALKINLSVAGVEDGIDIIDANRGTTILRFEADDRWTSK